MRTVFKSILCPVDFSPHSERALTYALELARLTAADVTIMTAVDPFMDAATSAAGHGEAHMRQTQEELQNLLMRITAEHNDPLRTLGIAVVKGDAAQEI